PQLYAADFGICSDSAARILDVNNGTSLPTPFTGPTVIYGLDSLLQFTAPSEDAAYETSAFPA
ncbi:MAG: hypothetical protein WCA77_05125, partial [Thermoplasmata archaeon]